MSGVVRFDQLDSSSQSKIRANIAQMESKGAKPEEIDSYLRDVEHLAPANASIPPHNSLGAPPLLDVPNSGILQKTLDAVPFATKGMAAVDALGHAIAGKGFNYEDQYLTRTAGNEHFTQQHPKTAFAATLAGAVAPVVATLGVSAPAEGALLAPKATLLARLGRGAVAGAGYGALQGLSEGHGSITDYQDKVERGLLTGGVAGAAASAAGAGLMAAARKLGVPDAVSSAADYLADQLPVANRYLRKLAQAFGSKGEANALVGQRVAMDQAAGFTPNDVPNSVPLIALNQGGPNVEKLAQGVVHGPAGPGQAKLVNTMTRQMAHMKPSVQEAITAGSGVSPRSGTEPLRQLIQEQSDEADQLFAIARHATEGQPVKSETLDAVMKTPVGQQAYAWAVAQKANRLSPMPQVSTVNTENALLKNLRGMGVPEDKAIASLGDQVMQTETLPDPETLHYMKQYLANVARLGVRDGAEGKLATQAQGAVSVWGMIRRELPSEWQIADAAFAKKAKLIGLMNEGRNVFRTQVNPPGRPRAAVQNSLDALKQRTAEAGAEGQQAVRTGVGMAAQAQAQRLGTSVKSPGRIFGGDTNAARMALGFKTPEQAQAFQRLVSAWDQIQAQTQRVLGNSATGGRVAEQSARAPDQATTSFFRELVHGNFGRALGTLGNQAGTAAEKAHRVEVDREIANILSNPNPNALTESRLAALLQLRLSGTAGRLFPRVAGSQAEAERQ